ncbi:AMP-binding protein [Streptomyces alkaliphilus]|uniref:AMP-binding protein n=1 Tax=Streptomyces alkaliphilus TaxID=1472722 RepID=A0A7W3XZQ4_9ACTN|nr:AMP-binding protein [Streptomyces alkaliphilus]MBB0242799.1 AMP-binding protein [Streptomyces alkaliphilus]
MPTPMFLTALTRRARELPDAPALTWRGRTVSYRELAAAAAATRAELAALDLPTGVPLCVPARKSPETVALVIACLQAGRRVLLPSAGLGAAALDELCMQTGCSHVLTIPASGPTGGTGEARLVMAARPSGHAPGPALPPGPGLLLTTSGSTGTPKTVVLDTDGVDRFLAWAVDRFGIGSGARVLNYAPLNFDLCLLDVWSTLAAGGCADLVDPDIAMDGSRLVAVCAERKPHVIQAVPLFFRLVTDASDRPLHGVHHILLTGDTVPVPLLERIAETFPGARLWNVYGCTETNDSFLHEIDLAEARAAGAIPIGRPIGGVHARVVGPDGRTVTGSGAGELLVSTPFQMRGYLGRSTVGDAGHRHDGMFRTGDLVHRDEFGLMYLTGRSDRQVKVRGVRTNLEEVERVLLTHPRVREVAVIAEPDDTAGHRLHAVVRGTPEARLNGLGLRVHCAAGLPRTAIPGSFDITHDPLPRTSTGKVDRNALRRVGHPDITHPTEEYAR